MSFEVEGEAIPLAGYAQMTLIGAVLGVLLAKALRRWAPHPQPTFVRTTVALTALSVVPDLTMGFDAASAVTLVVAHVAAAAIIVPRLADPPRRVTRPAPRPRSDGSCASRRADVSGGR